MVLLLAWTFVQPAQLHCYHGLCQLGVACEGANANRTKLVVHDLPSVELQCQEDAYDLR